MKRENEAINAKYSGASCMGVYAQQCAFTARIRIIGSIGTRQSVEWMRRMRNEARRKEKYSLVEY